MMILKKNQTQQKQTCIKHAKLSTVQEMTTWHLRCGFNDGLLVSVPDASLFCRPGNATGVVNADAAAAFFFTDTADVV